MDNLKKIKKYSCLMAIFRLVKPSELPVDGKGMDFAHWGKVNFIHKQPTAFEVACAQHIRACFLH